MDKSQSTYKRFQGNSRNDQDKTLEDFQKASDSSYVGRKARNWKHFKGVRMQYTEIVNTMNREMGETILMFKNTKKPIEAFEVTNIPVNLATAEHQLNSTGALTIGTSFLFPQEVEASEAINLPVTSTRGESIVNCLSTFEVGSTSSASYAANRSSSRRTSNRGMLLSTIVKKKHYMPLCNK
nr:uncharacterized protein LOC104648847 isoform X4 [Solanum lycopersicum]XP_025888098.1 uncharacterized protein LOC104648847 isoform X4 [Solanum lycopersicum]